MAGWQFLIWISCALIEPRVWGLAVNPETGSALTPAVPTNVTSSGAVNVKWPTNTERINLPLAQNYNRQLALQYFTTETTTEIKDSEGHSLENCFVQAQKMLSAPRDAPEAPRIRLEEQAVGGPRTAVVGYNPAGAAALPAELVASGLSSIYDMVHQYENSEGWKGLHTGNVYFRDEKNTLMGMIWWSLEWTP